MAHPSGSLEPSEPTSTGPHKVNRPPITYTHDGYGCWHTWTSNTWTSRMPQTWNCRAQLCCQTCSRRGQLQQKTPTTECQWMHDDLEMLPDTQLKRGPHQCIPRSLWRHQTLPRYLPHHPLRGCPTSCPCFMKVPYRNVAPGAWEAGWMGEVRHHYPSWRTDRLGIISCLLHETQWETTTLAWIPRTWMMQSRGTTTKPQLWKKSPTS